MNIFIIGAGMAGVKCAELLAEHDFSITLFSKEQTLPYNRILLSQLLAEEIAENDCILFSEDWYTSNGIRLQHESVENIDPCRKILFTNKKSYDYDILIFATGSVSFIPPNLQILNHLKNLVSFRTLEDLHTISSYKYGDNAIVTGGGLLGLEAAYALLKKGLNVTVIQKDPAILNRQLHSIASELLQESLEDKGITFYLNSEITEVIHNNTSLSGVKTLCGQTLAADLVIIAIGVKPEIRLAQNSGIEVDRGILVDCCMKTSHQDIYAIGECCQFEKTLFGLVAPCYEHAQVLCDYLTGKNAQYEVRPDATKLKVSGVNVYSAGDISPRLDKIEFYGGHVYKCLFFEKDTLVGVVLLGDVVHGPWFFQYILEKINVASIRSKLLFGAQYINDNT